MGYTHHDGYAIRDGSGTEIIAADSTGALYQQGTQITASAAELNIVDGQTYVNCIPVVFAQDNAAASQSAVAMKLVGSTTCDQFVMPRAGSVVGVSVYSNAAVTTSTAKVDVTIGGTATGLQATLDTTNTQAHYNTQAINTDTVGAGGTIGMKISTGATFAPTTADIIAVAFVEI